MSTVYSTLKSGCVGLGQYQQRGVCINLNPYLNQGVQDPCNRDTLSFEIDLMDVIKNVTEEIKGYQFTQCGTRSKISPCGICSKNGNQNQQAIFCSNCSQWYHSKCNGTSVSEYELLMSEDDNIP